jgi:hypothetical protein
MASSEAAAISRVHLMPVSNVAQRKGNAISSSHVRDAFDTRSLVYTGSRGKMEGVPNTAKRAYRADCKSRTHSSMLPQTRTVQQEALNVF